MAATEAEILQRSAATYGVMRAVQNAWEWDEMSVADFGALLQGQRAASQEESQKKVAYDAQRGVVTTKFDDLEARKVQGLGMASSRFRHQPEALALVEGVGEYGDSREMILKEADEWSTAWNELKTGTPPVLWNPTEENTRPNFLALMGACRMELVSLTVARTEWQKAAKAHNALLARIEDLCVAWYGTATRVFNPNSELGALIRGQIPTFSNETKETPPAPAPAP